MFGLALQRVSDNRGVRTFLAGIPLLYMFICFFRSFFLLRIPGVECYHMLKRHTDVYALSFNASYLCRLQFSLCYHFFTLLQLPASAYKSIALSAILGQMQTVKFLGKEFNFYMPAILVMISIFTLVRMLRKPAKKSKEALLESNELVTCKKMVVTTVLRRQRMQREQKEETTLHYTYTGASVA